MKPADPESQARAVESFVEKQPEPELTVVDRSTLAAYATCPAMARMIETGAVLSESHIAAVGTAVHTAFGQAITAYIDSESMMRPGEIADEAMQALRGSRPDLQPEAIRAAKYSLYSWARLIASMHGANILGYDGGDLAQSGQLAWDMPELGARVTSEIDLLYSERDLPELLFEEDYKTGNKVHTAKMVRDSFQFQLHAWLVFNNYESINGLRVRVWNTRRNQQTYTVLFRRDKLPDYAARIRTAVGHWFQWHNVEPERCPTWPTIEKCEICDAAVLCPASRIHPADGDWGTMVDLLVGCEAQVTAMKTILSGIVDGNGEAIESKRGNCFGRPKSSQKPQVRTYRKDQTDDPSD